MDNMTTLASISNMVTNFIYLSNKINLPQSKIKYSFLCSLNIKQMFQIEKHSTVYPDVKILLQELEPGFFNYGTIFFEVRIFFTFHFLSNIIVIEIFIFCCSQRNCHASSRITWMRTISPRMILTPHTHFKFDVYYLNWLLY